MKNTANELIIIGTGPQAQIARDYFHEFSDKKGPWLCLSRKISGKGKHLWSARFFYNRSLDRIPLARRLSGLRCRRLQKDEQDASSPVRGGKGFGFCIRQLHTHPKATVSESAHLGKNVFVFEDNTIQPYVRIGNNTVLWSGNHIGHHSTIGDHCFISSPVVVSGSCCIGNNVFVGVNATFRDSLTISDECLIGAGALIAKSTKPKEVYLSSRTKPFPKSGALGF